MINNDNNRHSWRRTWEWGIPLIFSLLLLACILLTSVEAVVYWTPSWFEKEYDKYMVLEDVRGEMSMDSALQVTNEMMKYLRGHRKNLVVYTTLDGKRQEFFSTREKQHLADCQVLFMKGFRIRNGCGVLCVGIFLMLGWRSWKEHNREKFAGFLRKVARVNLILLGVILVVALLVARNFDQYFVLFHHMFFNNNLWLLDPKVDNLINLLPEGFFSDTVERIMLIFIGSVLVISGIFTKVLSPIKE